MILARGPESTVAAPWGVTGVEFYLKADLENANVGISTVKAQLQGRIPSLRAHSLSTVLILIQHRLKSQSDERDADMLKMC